MNRPISDASEQARRPHVFRHSLRSAGNASVIADWCLVPRRRTKRPSGCGVNRTVFELLRVLGNKRVRDSFARVTFLSDKLSLVRPHPTPPLCHWRSGFGLAGFGPKALFVSRCGRLVWDTARCRASSLSPCSL